MSDLIAAPSTLEETPADAPAESIELDSVPGEDSADVAGEPDEQEPVSLLRPAPAPNPDVPLGSSDTKTDTPEATAEDLAVIIPDVSHVTIGGYRCHIRRLKARETLFLLRIITRGFGPGIADLMASFTQDGADSEDRAAELIAALLVAVPNAMNDFMELVTHLVAADDQSDRKQLADYCMTDLEMDDVITVIQAVVIQEVDDWERLVGNVRRAWETSKVAIAQARKKKAK